MTDRTALTFEIRPSGVALDNKSWPPKPELGPRILGHIYFVHPVKFSVNSVEMFGPQDNPLMLLPLISLGVFMRRALRESQDRESAEFEPLPGYSPTVFRDLPDGHVEVTGPSGGVAVAKRQDIESALDDFDAAVRNFLLREFPGVATDAAYGWWIRGESPPPDFFA